MSFQSSPAWKVTYEDRSLGQAFKTLSLVERVDTAWTTAVHTFGVPGGDNGSAWFDSLLPLLRGKIGKDFVFSIEDLSGSQKLAQHTHILTKIEEVISRDQDAKSQYRVETTEKRVLMDVNGVFSVRDGEISSMVSGLIFEAGLQSDVIEKTQSPDHFKTLHQPGWTNHEFVVYHLLSRARSESGNGGYQIYSNRGDRICFSTISYKPKELKIEKGQLKRVIETDSPLEALSLDGGINTMIGFDQERLMPVFGASVSNTKFNPKEFFHSPHQAQGLKVEAQSITDRSKRHDAFFVVHLRGNKKAGEIEFPLRIDLSGTEFRADDRLLGYAVVRAHTITNGVYSISIVCVK